MVFEINRGLPSINLNRSEAVFEEVSTTDVHALCFKMLIPPKTFVNPGFNAGTPPARRATHLGLQSAGGRQSLSSLNRQSLNFFKIVSL